MSTCPIFAGPVTIDIAGACGTILDVVCVGSPVKIIIYMDQSILLFFLPIFLSSNSFIFHLLCSIFCSRIINFAQQ